MVINTIIGQKTYKHYVKYVILGRVKFTMITKKANHWLDKTNKYVYNEIYRLFKMENRNVKTR